MSNLTDVNGMPLKFVAEFDGKKLESEAGKSIRRIGKKYRETLKDILKDLNIDTKPASQSLGKTTTVTAKAVVETKDLKTAFDHLTGSANTIHTGIAKAQYEIQNLTQTERDLRKALKEKIVTDDEYIKNLALISKRRTELNDKLREYRAELKKTQVQERTATKPYSSADTAFEITNMHGGGGEIKGGTVVNPKNIENATKANLAFASSAQQASEDLNKQAVSASKVVDISKEQDAILQSLKFQLKEYKQLADGATDPKLLKEYNSEIQIIETNIKQMSNVGKVGYDEFGNAIKKADSQGKGLVRTLSSGIEHLRRLAYIIPGLGISGIIALAIKPVKEYIKRLGEMRKAMNESFNDSNYIDALKNVKKLQNNIDLARQGIVSKDRVVREYNKTIGSTAGKLKTFGEVEKWVEENSANYIKALKLRAEAQALFNLSIAKTIEAQQRLFQGTDITWDDLSFDGLRDQVKSMIMPLGRVGVMISDVASSLKDAQEASDAWEETIKRSEIFNKKYGFDFEDKDKDKVKKEKKEEDPLLKELEERLKRQAVSFEKYEQFKTAVTEKEAKKRFAAEIGEFDKYASYVQSELDGLFDEAGTDEYSKFNQSQKNRYNAILEASRIYYEKEKDQANQAFIEAYEATKDHNQRLLDIDDEYYRRVAALGESATMEQLDILDQSRKERVSEEVSANLKIQTSWEETFAKMSMMSKSSVKKYLEDLQAKVDAELKAGKITTDEHGKLTEKIDDASTGNVTSFGRVRDSFRKYRDLVKSGVATTDELTAAFKKLSGAVSDAANDTNQILGTLSDTFKELGIGDESLDKTMNNIMGMVDGIEQIGAGIATGNPIAIVTGSIDLLTSAISLFNTKDKKIQKQIDGYQKQLDALGKAYKQLERDISSSVGESFYADSEKAISNMNEQIKATERILEAERRKKKSDTGKIQEYESQIDDLKFKIEDTQKSISEMLLQSDFKTFSNNLASALLSALEAGEDGIDAIDKAYKNFIKNAVSNSAMLKFIDPIIKDMMDDAADYASRNSNSLLGFSFEEWSDKINQAGTNFMDYISGAFESFGIEPDMGKSGIKGAFERTVTESSANEWIGLGRATYDLSKRMYETQVSAKEILLKSDNTMSLQLSAMNSQLRVLNQIQTNTANTVNRLDTAVDFLEVIAGNTGVGIGQSDRDLGI